METTPICRCAWVGSDPLMQAYHDEEWGVPEKDSRALWEKLILDGFQAGLSWSIILKRRDGFRRAFQNFEPEIIADYTEEDVTRLLDDAGIIRSRAKIEATIGNARAYLAMQEAGEDFSTYAWGKVGNTPLQNAIATVSDLPTKTALSEELSKDLKKRGFKFVGPVIVYAWMEAVGLVNDHTTDCFRYEALRG